MYVYMYMYMHMYLPLEQIVTESTHLHFQQLASFSQDLIGKSLERSEMKATIGDRSRKGTDWITESIETREAWRSRKPLSFM